MKVVIFGIPGSGKTHLAHTISEALNIPILHIDKHFFEKGWIERDHQHFLSDVRLVLKTKQWIIDGNGMNTLEMRYKEADIAIYCRLSRCLCLYRVFYRWISTFRTPKKDGPMETTNTVSWKLIKYLWQFPSKYKKQIEELSKKYPKVKWIEIRSKEQMQHLEKHCKEILKMPQKNSLPLRFEYLKEDQEEMVKQWLRQDYVSKFWYGIGLENTLKSITQFIKGEEPPYTLWIAYSGSQPFGYLMVSKVNLKKDTFYGEYLSPTSKAITVDLLIGDPSYLGKGLSHLMIKELLSQKYSDMTDVFIEPHVNNAKAIHVYKKAGFKTLKEFLPDWDPSYPCVLMHRKMKTGKSSTSISIGALR